MRLIPFVCRVNPARTGPSASSLPDAGHTAPCPAGGKDLLLSVLGQKAEPAAHIRRGDDEQDKDAENKQDDHGDFLRAFV